VLTKILINTLILLILNACAASRLVEPLHQGEVQLNATFGGPLFDYDGYIIPMPLSSVTIAHGWRDNLSLHGSVHTTSAIFGVFHTEFGFTTTLYKSKNRDLALSMSPSAHFMLDKWEHHFKFYPSFDLNFFSHVLGPNKLLYAGMSNWFELSNERAHAEKQPNHWIPAFHSGLTYQPDLWNYNIELKYIAPLHSNKDIVIDYLSPTDRGALGVYLSIGRSFK